MSKSVKLRVPWYVFRVTSMVPKIKIEWIKIEWRKIEWIKLVETDNSDNHADFISNKEENKDNLNTIDNEVMKKNKIQNRVETAIVDRIIEIKMRLSLFSSLFDMKSA